MGAAAAGAALLVTLVTQAALGNGRFPAAGYIAVDPSDAGHIMVRATYGLLTTRDGGANWDWICEQAVSWTGQYDPSIAITADGSVIAGIYDRLGVTHGDSCSWSHAPALQGKNVTDVSAERSSPSSALALTSNGLGAGMFLTQVWASPDNAASWAQAGVDLPADLAALTVDSAPSNGMRIYVSGLHSGGAQGAIERSPDRGKTWERVDIPGTNADKAPYIAAVDPTNEDVLYVRLTGSPGLLLVSDNGGSSWKEAFKGAGILKGFALSPDGSTILVGGETDGVWRAPSATLAFEKAADVGVQCLTWVESGLYACAGEFKDGFTVGLSTNKGDTFEPLMHLACLRGPLACDAQTSVGQTCPAAWDATADTIDAASCGAGAGGSAPDAGPNAVDPGEPGCGCRLPAEPVGWGSLAALSAGLALAARRARKANSDAGTPERRARFY